MFYKCVLIILAGAALMFESGLSSQSILSSPHFLKAKQEAAEREVNMLVHFTASWSNPCSKMFGTTYRDQRIQNILKEEVIFTLVDIDDFDGYVLAQHYNIQNLPTLVLFTPDGRILRTQRGFLNEEELAGFLNLELEWEAEVIADAESKEPGLMERINGGPGQEVTLKPGNSESKAEQPSPNQAQPLGDFFSIQLGAFSQRANAEEMITSFNGQTREKLLVFRDQTGDNTRYLLLGGRFETREEAEQFLIHLRSEGKDGFIKKILNSANS